MNKIRLRWRFDSEGDCWTFRLDHVAFEQILFEHASTETEIAILKRIAFLIGYPADQPELLDFHTLKPVDSHNWLKSINAL